MPEKKTIQRAKKRNAQERRLPRKQVSSFGRNCIMFEKANMAPAPPSRPSLSGYRKPVEQE